MKLLKLPMLMALIFIVVMYFVADSLGLLKYSFDNQWLVSAFVFLLGTILVLAGAYSFKVKKTTTNPLEPEKSTTLVTTGVYALSRNPMYVGFLLWLIATAVFIGSLINIVFVVLYFALANGFYIVREEKALENLFGKEYEEYKNKVRRWV